MKMLDSKISAHRCGNAYLKTILGEKNMQETKSQQKHILRQQMTRSDQLSLFHTTFPERYFHQIFSRNCTNCTKIFKMVSSSQKSDRQLFKVMTILNLPYRSRPRSMSQQPRPTISMDLLNVTTCTSNTSYKNVQKFSTKIKEDVIAILKMLNLILTGTLQ